MSGLKNILTILLRALIFVALVVTAARAAPLTDAQLATFRSALQAESDPELVGYRVNGQTTLIAAWYNRDAAPTFVVWRNEVKAEEIGNAWSGTDIDGMSALNMQRLQLLLASAPSGIFDMSRADRRAGFENPFGTNVNNASRVAMNAVWKRFASRVERLFATGTGSTASPGVLVFTGPLSESDVTRALSQ